MGIPFREQSHIPGNGSFDWMNTSFRLNTRERWANYSDRFPRKVVVKRKGKFPSKIHPKKLSLGIKQNNLPR